MKTLVIVYNGLLRGNINSWSTILNRLIAPLNADLGLCFMEEISQGNILFKNAKFIYTVSDPIDKYEYYKISRPNNINTIKDFFQKVNTQPFKESAFFTLTIKDIIFNAFKAIVKDYDQIILTRSDNYFLTDHPILCEKFVHIPSGEDWGGVPDRHIAFPALLWDKIMCNINTICDTNVYKAKTNLNAESIFNIFLKTQNIKYKRFQRNHFIIYNKDDKTCWPSKVFNEYKTVFNVEHNNTSFVVKYLSEYKEALKCLNNST